MNVKNLRTCRRCTGRCFIDRGTIGEESIDLVCINCGSRSYVNRLTPEGRFILKMESERGNA